MLEGLREVEQTLAGRGIRFVIRRGASSEVALALAADAALLVCDRGYLRHQKAWRAEVAERAPCAVVQVEGDVVVPVEVASDKAEFAARTLRPKLHRVLDDYLTPLDDAAVREPALDPVTEGDVDLSDLDGALERLKLDCAVGPVRRFRGGTREARRRLRASLEARLDAYAGARSEPAAFHCSLLSPYLHCGQISPVEVALAIRDASNGHEVDPPGLSGGADRAPRAGREFVHFEPDYDSYRGLPEWARATLERHRSDPREHIYTRDELVAARTHDRYWNAAMREMVHTGYMHNYMRMYWGKKILEWSPDPRGGLHDDLVSQQPLLSGRTGRQFLCQRRLDLRLARPPLGGTAGVRQGALHEANGLERKFDMAAYLRAVDELVDAERR